MKSYGAFTESLDVAWQEAYGQMDNCKACRHPKTEHTDDGCEHSGCRCMEIKEAKSSMSMKCLECGRKFKSSSMLPSCPKCGGSDIDLAEGTDALDRLMKQYNVKAPSKTNSKCPTCGEDRWKTDSGRLWCRTCGKYDRKFGVEEEDNKHVKSLKEFPFGTESGGLSEGLWDALKALPMGMEMAKRGVKSNEIDAAKRFALMQVPLVSAVAVALKLDTDVPKERKFVEDWIKAVRRNAGLHEETLPHKEIQRVFDETGDIGETEILCGVSDLKINGRGEVVSFIGEGLLDMFKRKPLERGEVEYRCNECFTKFRVKGSNNDAECPGCGSIDIESWDLVREETEKKCQACKGPMGDSDHEKYCNDCIKQDQGLKEAMRPGRFTEKQMTAAWKYASSMRNADKHEYALDCLDHAKRTGSVEFDDVKKPQGLGGMGAQAVRMGLRQILPEATGEVEVVYDHGDAYSHFKGAEKRFPNRAAADEWIRAQEAHAASRRRQFGDYFQAWRITPTGQGSVSEGYKSQVIGKLLPLTEETKEVSADDVGINPDGEWPETLKYQGKTLKRSTTHTNTKTKKTSYAFYSDGSTSVHVNEGRILKEYEGDEGIEASTLRFPPGQWPNTVVYKGVTYLRTMRKDYSREGEIESVTYVRDDKNGPYFTGVARRLIVYND